MIEEKILTYEIAEQFIADEDSVDLTEFTKIDEDAAEVLCSSEKYCLSLDGLAELSDAAAESLSKHKGEYLDLGGLTKLSNPAAESLSRFNGKIRIAGLLEINASVAESLSKHEGGWFVDSISNRRTLEFHNLMELTPEVSKSLIKVEGGLSFKVLSQITDEVAGILSNYKGDLSLNSISNLSDLAIESLSAHEGDLSLGLTELSDAAAESLSKHTGSLSLESLTELSDSAAKSLSTLKGDLSLGLTELSDAVLESISKLEGGLHLGDLSELSDTAAESLIFSKIRSGTELWVGYNDNPGYIHFEPGYMLSLDALESISVDQAKLISSVEVSELYLNELKNLSNEVAEILSHSKAKYMDLEGLTALSPLASISLSKFKGSISVPPEFMPLGPRVLTKEIAHQLIDDNYQESINAKYEYKLSGYYIDLEIEGMLSIMGVEDFTHIEDDAAEVLTRFRYNEDDDEKPLFFDTLELNGLVELRETAAEHLCGHLMDVELKGLSELSDAAAKSLAKMDSEKIHLPKELEAQVAKYR